MKTLESIFGILKDAFREGRRDKLMVLSSSLAYYLAFSLAPLFYLVLFIGGKIYEANALQSEVFYYLSRAFGGDSARFIQNILMEAKLPETFWGLVGGSAVLLFGAIGFYASLSSAFSHIYGKPLPFVSRKIAVWLFIRRRLLSFALIVLTVFILIVLVFANIAVALLRNYFALFIGETFSGYLLPIFNLAFSFFVISLLLALIYKILSSWQAPWKSVFFGAYSASFFFIIANFLLSVYFNVSNVVSYYGVGGSIVIILIWFYYVSQIFLFGGEVIKIHEKRISEES